MDSNKLTKSKRFLGEIERASSQRLGDFADNQASSQRFGEVLDKWKQKGEEETGNDGNRGKGPDALLGLRRPKKTEIAKKPKGAYVASLHGIDRDDDL